MRKPFMGWRDCKLHLFHAKQATLEQRRALAEFEGESITAPGGADILFTALRAAHGVGVSTICTSPRKGR